jgi:hypothetical protein
MTLSEQRTNAYKAITVQPRETNDIHCLLTNEKPSFEPYQTKRPCFIVLFISVSRARSYDLQFIVHIASFLLGYCMSLIKSYVSISFCFTFCSICGGSRFRSPSFSMVRLVVRLDSVASCDLNAFWMHAFSPNPLFYTRNTVIDRKSVILLTSVLVFKPGLMQHQFINQ